MSDQDIRDMTDGLDVAIVGMSGRFPGAANVAEFWTNLRDGVESITSFTDDQMVSFGVDPAALRSPEFVRAGAVLDNIDRFDAAFFGYSPREAETLDPQHRIFLECAWEALEDAGYDAGRFGGLIGVYAGTSLSTYLLFNILSNPLDPADSFQAMIGNDKDFLSTRVSYKLNLKGPSLDVQTACSTSLVAVHLAYQSLLNYQCDMALAGGVSVQTPQRNGYFYQKGGITSPDGHCRAFDARAEGTVFGSGAGIVVLRRLSDAVANGDHIYAVIKGSAMNNDGSSKLGYTAPSIEGQAQVIELAQMVAGVEPRSITYIEAHGTATALGDPAEVAALTKAFRAGTDEKQFCALGTVKSNVGHLDAAAGIAGLIKTALALKHRQIPPSLHCEHPNPEIDFANSPFYVNSVLADWDAAGPRRAGVSSFGIGGTNAHVILEEAAALPPSDPGAAWQSLVVSAKTHSALEAGTAKLREYLASHQDVCLADIAYTLAVGRGRFNYRRAITCRDHHDALCAIDSADPQRVFSAYQEPSSRSVIFMFPGGGAQYLDMGRGLYESSSVFREHLDECSEILAKHLGYDLCSKLYPGPATGAAVDEMKQTSLGLPALFAVEYALARSWMRWGVHPEAMIGHSLGEYVAACLSGVFSLEDAVTLVHTRARLFATLPKGAMLSVPLREREVLDLIDDGLSVAAVNGPSQCVVSGPAAAIDRFAGLLGDREIECRKLQIDVAAHSQMVVPVLEKFRGVIERMTLRSPSIPFVSNVTGSWIEEQEATDPEYWVSHLRQTVRFGEGLERLLDPGRVLLEVGPSQTLSTVAKLNSNGNRAHAVVPSMRHPYDKREDGEVLLTAVSKLWLSGVEIDWPRLYEKERRCHVALPVYQFERQRYWIDPGKTPLHESSNKMVKKENIAEWFYIPSWKRTIAGAEPQTKSRSRRWLIFEDDSSIGKLLAENIAARGDKVVRVRRGEKFLAISEEEYEIALSSISDYSRLLDRIGGEHGCPDTVIHLWSLGGDEDGKIVFQSEQERGFLSLIRFAQAVESLHITSPIQVWIVSNNLVQAESRDTLHPEKATMLAACKVIPQEFDNLSFGVIDIDLSDPGAADDLTEQIFAEAATESNGEVVAFRRNYRLAQTYEQVRLNRTISPAEAWPRNGVYLITGGLGGIGMLLAEYLAQTVQARLILTGRSGFPDRNEWDAWLANHEESDPLSRKILALRRVEALGGEIMIAVADVADEAGMRSVFDQVYSRFGRLDGVIHAAGHAGEDTIKLISTLTDDDVESQFLAKVYGVYALEKVLADRPPRFCLLMSSNAAILGGLGAAAYAGANAFMDAFAASRDRKNGCCWISANWDGWLLKEDARLSSSFRTTLDQYAMTPDESVEAFARLVSCGASGELIVSPAGLEARRDLWIKRKGRDNSLEPDGGSATVFHARPEMETAYVSPEGEIEKKIAEIWQRVLGVERLGVNDNFFDLGGNSLICLRVISLLKKELNVDVPVVAIFEGPTVKALAQLIGRKQSETPTYDSSRSRGERRREKRRRKDLQTNEAPAGQTL